MDEESAWKDAVPFLDEALDRLPARDRKLVFERFYEGKKFGDIARRSGQSEAACKMRLKRALEKMSTLLKARGVTLSVTVLASALGTELARSAPAQTMAVLSAQALATSSTIPTTTVVANILQTMSTAKTSALTSAAVLAIAAIPFAQQRAEARKMETRLAQIENRSVTSADNSLPGKSGVRTTGGSPVSPESLLAAYDEPRTSRGLIRDLYSRDGVTSAMARERVARMSPEERAELLGALWSYPVGHDNRRSMLEFLIKSNAGSPPDLILDQLIAGGHYYAFGAGSTPDRNLLTRWARHIKPNSFPDFRISRK